jgi:hypothetical protein
MLPAQPTGWVQAWVNYDERVVPAYIRAAANIAAITDHGVGDITVDFITPMQDANYVVAGMMESVLGDRGTFFSVSGLGGTADPTWMTTTRCRLRTITPNIGPQDFGTCIAAFIR